MVMDKPYIIAFPKGTDPAIVAKMSSIMKQITRKKPEYAQDLEKAYKQPVSFARHGRGARDPQADPRELHAIQGRAAPVRKVSQQPGAATAGGGPSR